MHLFTFYLKGDFMKDRKQSFPGYARLEGDDIRTIPDFYDNLYPAAEAPENSIIIRKSKQVKKRASTKNSEKSKVTIDENQNLG